MCRGTRWLIAEVRSATVRNRTLMSDHKAREVDVELTWFVTTMIQTLVCDEQRSSGLQATMILTVRLWTRQKISLADSQYLCHCHGVTRTWGCWKRHLNTACVEECCQVMQQLKKHRKGFRRCSRTHYRRLSLAFTICRKCCISNCMRHLCYWAQVFFLVIVLPVCQQWSVGPNPSMWNFPWILWLHC